VHPTEPDADPLHDWLVSLNGLKHRVPDDVLVLPAITVRSKVFMRESINWSAGIIGLGTAD